MVSKFDSARYGIVVAIISGHKTIKKGEEITTAYGYKLEESAPLWYKYALRNYLRDNPNSLRTDQNMIKILRNKKHILDSLKIK